MKLKIVNKKKFISSMILISTILISIFNFCFAKSNESIIEDYVVSSNDTLWNIACEYKKEKQDVREYVYQLKELNNIDDCIIYPGQTIKIIK